MSKKVTLELSEDAAFVLLRCLAYGENAISKNEEKSGVGNVIRHHIQLIRKNVANNLMDQHLVKIADHYQ